MQINIIRCLPAKAVCLWLVQLHALTGNRDELVFLFLFIVIYILCRLTYHKDRVSSTLLILCGAVSASALRYINVSHDLIALQQS